MNPEGRLEIRLIPDGRGGQRVQIVSSRPLALTRIFHGKTPAQLIKTLPLLYRVCGVAQAAAAHGACAQALQIPANPEADRAREALVWLETAREHLWRILVDWPRLSHRPLDPAEAAPLSGFLPQARQQLFAGADPFDLESARPPEWEALPSILHELKALISRWITGEPPEQWLSRQTPEALEAWIGDSDTLAAAMLRRVEQRGWAGEGSAAPDFLPSIQAWELDSPLGGPDAQAFIAVPQWEGRPRETSPFSRAWDSPQVQAARTRWGPGLMTRLVARLAEAASIPQRLAEGVVKAPLPREAVAKAPLPPGRGVGVRGKRLNSSLHPSTLTAGDAQEGKRNADPKGSPQGEEMASRQPSEVGIAAIEAARGLLVHRVALQDGVIRDYRILAPTEWNFHPQGPAAQALGALSGDDHKTLRERAELLITAVDPCVGYGLEVG